MVFYRILIGTLTQFCLNDGIYCNWILIGVSLVSSFYLVFEYFKYIPYYNSFVSVFFGAMVAIFAWFAINSLLMELIVVNGQILVIFSIIPGLVYLVKCLRDKRIQSLLVLTTDKMKSDIDSLN
jgi:hypothetical protein